MKRFVAFAFALVCWLVPCIAPCQGLAWDQSVDALDARFAVDAGGNLYLASMRSNGSSYFVTVDAFNANGVRLAHVPYNIGSPGTSANILGVWVVGDVLRIVVAYTDQATAFCRLYWYSIAGKAFTDSVTLVAPGDGIRMQHLAVGTTTFGMLGSRASDGALSFQRRPFSDETFVERYLTSTATSPGSLAFRTGNEYLIAGTYMAGSDRYLRLYRVANSTTSYSKNLNYAGSATPKVMASGDRTVAWFAWSEQASQYSFSSRATSFNLSTNVFGAIHPLNPSGMTSSVLDMDPSGPTGVAVVRSHDYQNFKTYFLSTSIGVEEVFTPPPGNHGAMMTALDAQGNFIVGIGQTDGLAYGVRLDSADRSHMNSFGDFNASGYPTYEQMHVDAAGRIFALFAVSTWFERVAHVIRFDPAAVSVAGAYTVGGDNAIGTVRLSRPAPPGGATFQLFSNNVAATVPANVSVPEGLTSQTFTINTTPVAANAKPAISARYDGLIVQTTFDLAAPLIQSVTATPQKQYGGIPMAGNVILTGDAPSGGKQVFLSSSNPAKVTVPGSVWVSVGTNTKAFSITTFPTLINASSVITATTGAVSKTVFVAVNAPVFSNAVLGASTIKGGLATTMTVTLGSKAPSSYTVTLVSGAPGIVPLPSSYLVPAGQTTAQVPVDTNPVTSTTVVSLVAYRGPYVKVMSLTVTP